MNSTKPRDGRFDFYKAILMLGVVWGHVINSMSCNTLSIPIHTFFRTYDMPMFMAISGLFFRKSCEKYSARNLFLDKVTTILFPSILWSLVLSRFHSIDEYYFLNAVFISCSIVLLFHFLIKDYKFRIAILFAFSLVFYFVDYDLDNLSYLYPFFVMGYSFPNIWNITKKPKILVPIILAFSVCLCFWDTQYNIWNAGSYLPSGGGALLLKVAFRMTIAFVGMMSIKWLCDVFYNYLEQNNEKLMNYVLEVGRESFSIYIFHCFALVAIAYGVAFLNRSLGHNLFTLNENLSGYVIAPITSVIIIYCVILLVRVLKKNSYLKLVLGFKVKELKNLK